MDANTIAAIAAVLELAFAVSGAVLSVILLRDRMSQQQRGKNCDRQ